MIVKTGANYQAEGGYIEAGYDNGVVTIKKNDWDAASIGIGENGAVVEVEVQNDTLATFTAMGFSNLTASLTNVYGPVGGVISANGTSTFKTLALINILQRISYSGDSITNLKVESAYVDLVGSGNYYALKIVKMPPAGEKIKMRLYLSED